MSLQKRALAEFLGTLWLVFGGCGSAVLAAAFPNVGIGLLGVALAFGLTVLTMAYAIGHISGCHLNPAVSVGLASARRFPASELPAYIAAQLAGGIALTFFFLMIILGATDRRAPQGLAPIAIGLGLTLIHLIGIPITNLSVNPARSTGPAIFVGGWALQQLWLFWVAPIIGAVVAAAAYRVFEQEETRPVAVPKAAAAMR